MRLTGKTLAIAAGAVLVCAAIVAAFVIPAGDWRSDRARSFNPVWTEAAWPFPVDPWGRGKAFQCKAADCGSDVHLYIRAKLGFCNCATGIADDGDLEQMGDLALVGGEAKPLGEGRQITVGSMRGRSRGYAIRGAPNNNGNAISLAFNQRCDMVAALILLEQGAPASLEPAVLAFLNSERVLKWAETALGL